MTIIRFPIEIQHQVYQVTGQPPAEDPINVEVKFTRTLPEEIIGALKALGVQFMTPVKEMMTVGDGNIA